MLDYGLSTQQLDVICALSNGATMTAAAEEAGVHRNTILNWQRNLLPFQQAVAHAQHARALYFREKIEERVDLAFKALDEILADPQTPKSIRLRAVLAVVLTAATPPAPKKQLQLDIEKIVVHKGEAAVTEDQMAPAPPQPAPENPQNPPNSHNNAQSSSNTSINSGNNSADISHKPAQIRREIPKIGRNDHCPCGSGLKYKRCCLDKPQTKAA